MFTRGLSDHHCQSRITTIQQHNNCDEGDDDADFCYADEYSEYGDDGDEFIEYDVVLARTYFENFL